MQPFFEPGQSLETARLRLAATTTADLVAMPWLAGALAPDWQPEDLAAHVEAGEAALIRSKDARAIGIAVTIRGRPEANAASIPLIAIAPNERFRGLGGEAALALEKQAVRRWGIRRLLAPVPQQRGLAVYFWLRLGFRPLTRAEAPWPLVGLHGKTGPGIWMASDATR